MMSRVKRITVSNLKAVAEKSADFNGCTAIVTGGNNKGKSTFLRSLPDRIHGIKPDLILKTGEKEGYAEWILTTGEKFVWSFEEKPNRSGAETFYEKLTYITTENIKNSLTREIALKFFPPVFNVDLFLTSTPKDQRKMLQKLVGLDFSDIDNRYLLAYNDREGKNRRALEEKIVFEKLEMPEQINHVDLDVLKKTKEEIRNKLNNLYLSNKKSNDAARNGWEIEKTRLNLEYDALCDIERTRVFNFNSYQTNAKADHTKAVNALNVLLGLGYKGDAMKFVNGISAAIQPQVEYKAPERKEPLPEEPVYISPEKPDDAELVEIDRQITDAVEINQKAQLYKDWEHQRDEATRTKEEATEAERKVQIIESERMEMIKSAKMPQGFGFDGDGVTYNELPFTREQLSSSGIYIAALKLAAMTLGEVKTLHFDASFLDKKSLLEIEKWAESEDLQLLIERPDFEGGEIEYQLINETK